MAGSNRQGGGGTNNVVGYVSNSGRFVKVRKITRREVLRFLGIKNQTHPIYISHVGTGVRCRQTLPFISRDKDKDAISDKIKRIYKSQPSRTESCDKPVNLHNRSESQLRGAPSHPTVVQHWCTKELLLLHKELQALPIFLLDPCLVKAFGSTSTRPTPISPILHCCA